MDEPTKQSISDELLSAIMEAASKLTELDKEEGDVYLKWQDYFRKVSFFIANIRADNEGIYIYKTKKQPS